VAITNELDQAASARRLWPGRYVAKKRCVCSFE
jgi:hypothetical protein